MTVLVPEKQAIVNQELRGKKKSQSGQEPQI
jgi:hypothetical protein